MLFYREEWAIWKLKNAVFGDEHACFGPTWESWRWKYVLRRTFWYSECLSGRSTEERYSADLGERVRMTLKMRRAHLEAGSGCGWLRGYVQLGSALASKYMVAVRSVRSCDLRCFRRGSGVAPSSGRKLTHLQVFPVQHRNFTDMVDAKKYT